MQNWTRGYKTPENIDMDAVSLKKIKEVEKMAYKTCTYINICIQWNLCFSFWKS